MGLLNWISKWVSGPQLVTYDELEELYTNFRNLTLLVQRYEELTQALLRERVMILQDFDKVTVQTTFLIKVLSLLSKNVPPEVLDQARALVEQYDFENRLGPLPFDMGPEEEGNEGTGPGISGT